MSHPLQPFCRQHISWRPKSHRFFTKNRWPKRKYNFIIGKFLDTINRLATVKKKILRGNQALLLIEKLRGEIKTIKRLFYKEVKNMKALIIKGIEPCGILDVIVLNILK